MYKYAELKPTLFTEDGVRKLMRARDKAQALLQTAGAFQLDRVTDGLGGDSWQSIACVDYMVEQGEIREVTNPDHVMGQHRVFVKGR